MRLALSTTDVVAAFTALIGATSLMVSTWSFIEANDLQGLYFLALGGASMGLALRLSRPR